jgi:hypothetical protein
VEDLLDAHYKGLHVSAAALAIAHPTASPGDYANVDPGGTGTQTSRYLWDDDDAQWVLGASGGLDHTHSNIAVLDLTTASFTTAHETKLNSVETDAKDDQTGAEIKALYEAESSAFTDAQFTKLAGIETDATADLTAAEIVSLLDGYLGSTDWRVSGGESHSHTNQDALDTFTLDGERIYTDKALRPGVFEAANAPDDSIYIDVDNGHAMRKHEDGIVHVLDNEEGVYNEYGSGNPTVATPTFSPVAGSYGSTQNITIATVTAGASIKWTTDGSTPSPTNGTLYSGTVEVASSLTLKAVGYKSGYSNSAVASAPYTIGSGVVAPVFSPVSGTYESAQQVTITTTTSGATIRYTTDGSEPTDSYGTIYTVPLSVSETDTIKAIAYKAAMADSAVVSATYTISGESAAPHYVSWASGGFLPINIQDGDTLILYVSNYETYHTDTHRPALETDGWTFVGNVKSSNETYEGQHSLSVFSRVADGTEAATTGGESAEYVTVCLRDVGTVSKLTQVRQIALGSGVDYPQNPNPAIRSMVLHAVASNNSESTGREQPEAVSLNGDPAKPDVSHVTASGMNDITVVRTQDIQMGQYTPDFRLFSQSASGSFSTMDIGLALKVQTPVITPATDTYAGTQSTTITTGTSGASIRYTTDGSTPTSTTGTIYTGAFDVTATSVVKAIAYKTDEEDSDVTTETLTIVSSIPSLQGQSDDGNYPTVSGGILAGDLIVLTMFDTAVLPDIPAGFTGWDSEALAYTRIVYKVAAGGETGAISNNADAVVAAVFRDVDVAGTDVSIAWSAAGSDLTWASAYGSGDGVVCLIGSHEAWGTNADDLVTIQIGTGTPEFTTLINNGGSGGDPLRTKMWTRNASGANAATGYQMQDASSDRKIAIAIHACKT